jgi:O-antigen/teichoic acid export membrane protein
MKGAGAVGVYGVATRTAELLNFVLLTQNAVFASTAASLYATGDLGTLQRLVTKLTRLGLYAILPPAVVFAWFGHWFLLYCYGPEYTPAKTALAILTLGQVVNVAMGACGMLLTMCGHERYTATALGVAALTNIVLNLALVPHWGPEGAAVGNTISMVLWNVLAVILLYRKAGVNSTAFGEPGLRRFF